MLYFGIQITPKHSALKQQIYIYIFVLYVCVCVCVCMYVCIYIYIFFLISVSGVRSLEWLDWKVWLRVPMRLSQDTIQGCCHLEDWLGLKGLLPRWLIHMAVVRKPQFLAMRACPLGCLCVLMTWWLASPMAGDQKRKQGDTTVLSST